ncbi:MAG: hypothetical protein AABY10_01440, partial [Nanoarchaeota archaeon]
MNKKADASFLLCILVAIAFCIATFMAFITSNAQLKEASQDLEQLSIGIQFFQTYAVEESKIIFKESLINCPSCSLESLKRKITEVSTEKDQHLENSGNLFGKFRNSEFEIEKKENLFTLKIPSVFVKSESKNSEITKN